MVSGQTFGAQSSSKRHRGSPRPGLDRFRDMDRVLMAEQLHKPHLLLVVEVLCGLIFRHVLSVERSILGFVGDFLGHAFDVGLQSICFETAL
ncbi:hypothetical protein JCGZ_00351 [Jatropha curcas]|uniref:Uncharacterized protein n=1 Tax=Jatropha curcas TaxID=180498 RepID=A0A067JH16_JATCU|nr:hypothetical protein JCGZ_00351 [Jatropha curcas]